MATVILHANWWIECFTLLTPYPTVINQVKIASLQLLSHSWQSLATNGNWEGCVSQIGNVTFALRNVHICTSTLLICQKSMMEQLTCIYLLPCPIQGNIQGIPRRIYPENANEQRKCVYRWPCPMVRHTVIHVHIWVRALNSKHVSQQVQRFQDVQGGGLILYCLGECVTCVHPV